MSTKKHTKKKERKRMKQNHRRSSKQYPSEKFFSGRIKKNKTKPQAQLNLTSFRGILFWVDSKEVKPLGFDPTGQDGAYNNRKHLKIWESALFSG